MVEGAPVGGAGCDGFPQSDRAIVDTVCPCVFALAEGSGVAWAAAETQVPWLAGWLLPEELLSPLELLLELLSAELLSLLGADELVESPVLWLSPP